MGAGGSNRVYTYTMPTPRTCNALAVNTQKWVAGGIASNAVAGSNSLAYSLDGLTWSNSVNGTATFPFSGGICNAIAWNGSKWVAGGTGSNALAYSYDGVTWYQSSFSGMTQCNGLTWNGSYWLAVGQGSSSLAYSQDGINWLSSSAFTQFAVGRAIASRKALVSGSGSTAVSIPTLNQTLGYNQTWQNTTGIRAAGVPYYNTTGRPIMVCISFSLNYADTLAYFYVGSTLITYTRTSYYNKNAISVIVPPNNSYQLNLSAGNFIYWNELR